MYKGVYPPFICFHPFQGRAPFGLNYDPLTKTLGVELFPSLSGKTFIRTPASRWSHQALPALGFHPFQGRPSFGLREFDAVRYTGTESFHPFQGRPSFGPRAKIVVTEKGTIKFPSLSGKTFIRTFRDFIQILRAAWEMFPSLSGKTFIRTDSRLQPSQTRAGTVSIPFREDLHSDTTCALLPMSQCVLSFHPFQGRPSFGLDKETARIALVLYLFPSLSGKTSIRT